jgi:hypothetical protein
MPDAPCGPGHGRRDRLGVDRGQRAASSSSTQENMKQKKAATPMPACDQRHEDLDEELRERIAVDIGGLVDLLRHAAT